MKRFVMFVAVVSLSLAGSSLLLSQTNPALGTWKLNLAKSKYVNAQAPKNESRTVEAQGNAVKYTYEGVAADGSKIAFSFATNYDGKDSPISGVGYPDGADTIAITRVDANTTKASAKKAGKLAVTTTSVVSDDGKVTTNVSKWTNAQGQPASITTVWDKL